MIDPQPTVLSLTDAAASKLREHTKEETNPDVGLRVYVYSGGCSGYKYGMMLEDAPTAESKLAGHGRRARTSSWQSAAPLVDHQPTALRTWLRAVRPLRL